MEMKLTIVAVEVWLFGGAFVVVSDASFDLTVDRLPYILIESRLCRCIPLSPASEHE